MTVSLNIHSPRPGDRIEVIAERRDRHKWLTVELGSSSINLFFPEGTPLALIERAADAVRACYEPAAKPALALAEA